MYEISYPVIWGFHNTHEIRIPIIKQPAFNGKVLSRILFVAHLKCFEPDRWPQLPVDHHVAVDLIGFLSQSVGRIYGENPMFLG